MQETQSREGGLEQEFFHASSENRLTRKMEKRMRQLEKEGHTLVRRVPISMRAYKKARKNKNLTAKKSRAKNRKR